ncbi:YciI family protein [uncultured Shewanella sp.]|uniref:YciI family protein n=1 Tax=uncultured Shewanella sp. TaxID=173975 RepID=UPI00262E53C4|nr:YciI family protein [uncultured Shewanella sp.]
MEVITPELRQLHRNYLALEYEKNHLIFGGRKIPDTNGIFGGIIISQHESREALESCLAEDPFIKSGSASYTITEFIPVMAANDYRHILGEVNALS